MTKKYDSKSDLIGAQQKNRVFDGGSVCRENRADGVGDRDHQADLQFFE